MKIIIATGIFPPEVGGPAYYSAALRDALASQGHEVRVVLYGSLKKLPFGIRHALYTLKLLWRSAGYDAIVAFDTFSVGLPAALVSGMTRIRVVARIGGDFMWETYTERSNDLVTLPQVYEVRDRWSMKERVNFRLQRWVIKHVHLAFSCAWIRDIWTRVYALDAGTVSVVENALPPREAGTPPTRKNFLFYTRPLALKNNEAFRRAFMRAKEVRPEIELEEGMIPHEELLRRMKEGYAIVLPSISDVTPNYIVDAIRFGKPFLLTKHSGYAETFRDLSVVIDPFSEEDMMRGILALADDAAYAQYAARIAAFTDVRTYDDIARDFVALIQNSQKPH